MCAAHPNTSSFWHKLDRKIEQRNVEFFNRLRRDAKVKRILYFLMIIPWLVSCGGSEQTPSGAGTGTPAQIQIISPAFGDGEPIPIKYSCKGEDRSPELKWNNLPQGTQSLALILDDPDAPGKTWVHWVVYNLPPDSGGLGESASIAKGESTLPVGAQAGKNSWGREDYGGPCPPSGTHHYIFHLYALDTTLEGKVMDKTTLLKTIDGHVLGQGELTGTYAK
jgi:Raf kinase inhibitor-like YbhB/YbcL family protein